MVAYLYIRSRYQPAIKWVQQFNFIFAQQGPVGRAVGSLGASGREEKKIMRHVLSVYYVSKVSTAVFAQGLATNVRGYKVSASMWKIVAQYMMSWTEPATFRRTHDNFSFWLNHGSYQEIITPVFVPPRHIRPHRKTDDEICLGYYMTHRQQFLWNIETTFS